MINYNLAIIWWTDWLGKWIAEYILNNFPNKVNITITWRNTEKWANASNELWCNYTNDNIEATKQADIVICAVPINNTQDTLKQIVPFVKSGSTLVDVTSVKLMPSKMMTDLAQKDVLIIPTHPMFWPYISTIAGQIFVLTANKETQKDRRYRFLKEHLIGKEAKIIETTPKQHDKIMAVVQGLTHFTLFVMWKTMKRLQFDIDLSQNFISPIYKILTASIWRYLSQWPWLYADIQMYNPEIINVHEVFIQVANEFNKMVKSKNRDEFKDLVISTHKYFWNWAEEWQVYTDKLIYLNWRQIEKISDSIWKIWEFENIYDKQIIKWIINRFENGNVFLDNGKTIDINEWIII